MYVHVVALQSQLRRLSFLDQMEGVRLFNIKDLLAASGQEDATTDLQKSREICTVRHMSYTLFLSYYPTILSHENVLNCKPIAFLCLLFAIHQRLVSADLQRLLSGLARHLFGETEQRMAEDFFPFTSPSFELEVRCVLRRPTIPYSRRFNLLCPSVGALSGSLAGGAGLRSDSQAGAGQCRPGSRGSLRLGLRTGTGATRHGALRCETQIVNQIDR